MSNESMIKITERLNSIGFWVDSFKYLHDYEHFYEEVEFLITSSFSTITPIPKEKMIQLIENLHSIEFGIINCSPFYRNGHMYFKLILYNLEKTKTS
jgi:hypothetical protein